MPYRADLNSYWTKDNDDQWSNLVTDTTHIGHVKTQITLQITEGGNFDSDSDATTLAGLGAAGALISMVPMLSYWMIILLALLLALFTYLYIARNKHMNQ